MLFEAGHVIDGKYRLVRLIGTGGMGSVYEGENLLIRRRVAIKILHVAATGNTDAIRRFEREAQAAGEIGNDHILEVLDLGSLPTGDRYMVMEYLDGETLAARIERHGRLTPGQIAPIARQFLTASSPRTSSSSGRRRGGPTSSSSSTSASRSSRARSARARSG
jgi:eukaryotic-like serine/threonine-protein kinase